MEWIQSMLIAIAGIFGLGDQTVTVEPEPVAVVEEVAIVDEVVMEKDETASSTEAEATSEADTDPAAAMVDDGEAITPDQITAQTAAPAPAADVRTMLVAGGCFWCVESDLEKTPGVLSAVSGYAGGTTENPTYDNYGDGGHREVVEVTYDANQVSFEDLLIVTLKTTDPTDDDGTFADRGDKYSAAFYYENAAQKEIIDNLIAEVDEFGPYDAPLAIDVEPRATFWEAEDFHQDYYKGSLSKFKYQFYRNASGRDDFIETYWPGNDVHSGDLPWRTADTSSNQTSYMWSNYVKPDKETLKATLEPLAFKVTQEDGTERAGTHPYDKLWDDGIYVDILSGEPLYSSKDKFDSGTGWPSFVKPITPDALTLHEDRKLFTVRTETRSAIADNHIGHVFNDGPADRGGLRYCMNGAALEFIPKDEMEAKGYGDFLQYL